MAMAARLRATRVELASERIQARLPSLLSAMRRSPLPRAGLLAEMAAHHMGWSGAAQHDGGGGKMLRGCLCMWACEAAGGDPEVALPTAVAVEWIHNFTLIHDDVQDHDRERRHRPTVWTVYGKAQAINAGDALHAWANRVLLDTPADPRRVLAAARALDDAVLCVIDGQCRDIALEGRAGTSPATYLQLIRAKTGALFGAALECGALVGGSDGAGAARFREVGQELGAAFQVRDDWLGSFGDPVHTGKSRVSDLERRKLTHVIVAAHAAADGAQRAELVRLMAHPDPATTAQLRALVERLGAADASAQAAVELAERGISLLPDFVADRHRAELREVADHAALRLH